MEKQYHFLYKTTNLVNDKFYIGIHSTNDLNDGYLGSGRRLKYAVKKYGKNNFVREIITFVDSRENLIDIEKNIVNLELLENLKCMNLIEGGKVQIDISKQTEYGKSGGLAFKHKLNTDSEFRKLHGYKSSERLKKLHKNGCIPYGTFKGKKHNELTKEKMQTSKLGRGLGNKNSQFGTCWITKDNINKKINSLELENYLKDKWVKGRYLKIKST